MMLELEEAQIITKPHTLIELRRILETHYLSSGPDPSH